MTLISIGTESESVLVCTVIPPRRLAASNGVTAATGVTSAISLSATRIFIVPTKTSKFFGSITRSTRACRPRLFSFTRSPTFTARTATPRPPACAAGSFLSAPVVCATTVELNCSENSRLSRAILADESRAIFFATALSSIAFTISRSWPSNSPISEFSLPSSSFVRAFCSARPSVSSRSRSRAISRSRKRSVSRSPLAAVSCACSWSSSTPISAPCVVSCARAAATISSISPSRSAIFSPADAPGTPSRNW